MNPRRWFALGAGAGLWVGWWFTRRGSTSLSEYYRRRAVHEARAREAAERRALEAESFADAALDRERELERRLALAEQRR